jgi:hypothetical protein
LTKKQAPTHIIFLSLGVLPPLNLPTTARVHQATFNVPRLKKL